MIGSDSSTFSAKVRDESYLPPMGFAAATTEQRAWSDVTMPALDTEIVCCSMACAHSRIADKITLAGANATPWLGAEAASRSMAAQARVHCCNEQDMPDPV
jgi:hypothetical protein